jgi:hypothetical protein
MIAVREELAAHEVKIGGGSEQPLEQRSAILE